MSSVLSELTSEDLAYALSGYRERLCEVLELQAEAYSLAGELEAVALLRDGINALANLAFEVEQSYGRSPLGDELHGPFLRYLDGVAAGLLGGEPLSRDGQLALELSRGLAEPVALNFRITASN